jgi:hypothetical protein
LVQEHVRLNFKAGHKETVSNLIGTLFVPENISSDEKDEVLSKLLNKFWMEWDEFNGRTGRFDSKKFFWGSHLIDENKSHFWHKLHSLIETEVLGKLGCNVHGIAGIGGAERSWGEVKHLKTGQRAHLSSAMISKSATIYGSACADRATKRAQRKTHADDVQKMWDDVDMDNLGLGKFGIDTSVFQVDPSQVRVFKCYIEDWEDDAILKQDYVNLLKLLKKYGGLQFEEGGRFTIDSNKMNFQTKKNIRGTRHWVASRSSIQMRMTTTISQLTLTSMV